MNKEIGTIRISDQKQIYKANKFVEEICDLYCLQKEYFGNMSLAVHEAVEVIFKNTKELRCNVRISAYKVVKGIRFYISSDSDIPDEQRELDVLDMAIEGERMSRETYLIKSLSDEFSVDDHWRTMELLFFVTSMSYETSLKRIQKLRDYFSESTVMIKDRNE